VGVESARRVMQIASADVMYLSKTAHVLWPVSLIATRTDAKSLVRAA